MAKKDQPQVEQHSQKQSEGWLMSQEQQLICCFRNALPSAHAKWIEVETRPLHGSGQPVVRQMLRHNAIEAWERMLKARWVRCQPRW